MTEILDDDWALLRSFVGAKFCHGGRDVKLGVDCVGLLISFYEAKFGHFPLSVSSYGRSESFHPHKSLNPSHLNKLFQTDNHAALTKLIVLKLAQNHYHLSFLRRQNSNLVQIHATSKSGVIEETFRHSWHNKIIAAYRLEKR